MRSIRIMALLCLGLFLAGCIGTPFRWDTARKIQVGMTKEQVVAIMGKPYVISTSGDDEFWTWNYGTGLGTGGYFRIVLRDGKVTEVPKISDSL